MLALLINLIRLAIYKKKYLKCLTYSFKDSLTSELYLGNYYRPFTDTDPSQKPGEDHGFELRVGEAKICSRYCNDIVQI